MSERYRDLHVIVNPQAGSAEDQQAALRRAIEGIDLPLRWVETRLESGEGPAERARQAVEAGADAVLACGGDGTVLGVAEGLLGSELPMGVVPLGTANVFAAEMGLPADPESALRLVTEGAGRVQAVDVGRVGDQHFLLRVGIGWQAAVTVLTDVQSKKTFGRLAYLWTGLRAWRSLQRTRYEIEIDGRQHRVTGVTCVVCNSSNLGLTGMDFLPEIQVGDGKLDVIVLRNASPRYVMELAGRWAWGQLARGPRKAPHRHMLWLGSGRSIHVTARPSQVVARDGEAMEDALPARIEVLPAALRVIVPEAPR